MKIKLRFDKKRYVGYVYSTKSVEPILNAESDKDGEVYEREI